MKITKQYLKQVIKEEIEKVNELLGNLPEIPSSNPEDQLTPQQSENFVNSILQHKFTWNEILQAIRLLPNLNVQKGESKSELLKHAKTNLQQSLSNNGFQELKGKNYQRAVQEYFLKPYFYNEVLGMANNFDGAEKAIEKLASDFASIKSKYDKAT